MNLIIHFFVNVLNLVPRVFSLGGWNVLSRLPRNMETLSNTPSHCTLSVSVEELSADSCLASFKTELRKTDRTVGVNCYIFSNTSSGMGRSQAVPEEILENSVFSSLCICLSEPTRFRYFWFVRWPCLEFKVSFLSPEINPLAKRLARMRTFSSEQWHWLTQVTQWLLETDVCSPIRLSVSLAFIASYIKFTDTPIAIKADPPSRRMPWENCRAFPSHQLPHVLCGAGA